MCTEMTCLPGQSMCLKGERHESDRQRQNVMDQPVIPYALNLMELCAHLW